MVVAISVLLMTVSVTVYLNCLKIYREGQGVANVFETSKLVNRDLRDLLAHVVPLPGSWLPAQLQTRKFPGRAGDAGESEVSFNYVEWYNPSRFKRMSNTFQSFNWGSETTDNTFSGPQDAPSGARGEGRSIDPAAWATRGANQIIKSWWMPGFFGKRDGANPALLAANDFQAGSWGWPRADYRLDADADHLASHANIACWFYTEDRFFNSPTTLALDNANIVLASLKFSMRVVDGEEETQLSILKHHICGNDHPTMNGVGLIRSDVSFGNMLRAIEIKPFYLNAGALTTMDDAALGSSLSTGAAVAGGNEVPRCFDVRYTLRNLTNNQRYKFVLRVYCDINLQ